MKRFDPDAITDRLLQRITKHEEWNKVISKGTIGTLLRTVAESEAEIARYIEYLFLEKKWRTARNITSLTHQADLIGRKRHMAKSAIGYIVVTHTDTSGKNRLKNYGSIYYSLDEESDFDDINQNTSANYIEKEALVPWTSNNLYSVPKGTIFRAANGTQFISTEALEIKSLKEPYSLIKSNPERLLEFQRSGGWNGIKYLKVPVIQGIQQKITLGTASGARFESFSIESSTVEAGENAISQEFFKIKVVPVGLTEDAAEEWVRVDNIYLGGTYDKVYELKYLTSTNKVLVKFGDGLTGMRLPTGSTIICEYLDTKGSLGNIEDKFQITSITLPDGQPQIDPRTNTFTEFLYCTNVLPIMGGDDVEDVSNFKTTAPSSYLKSYTIATTDMYEDQIKNYAPVSILKMKIFSAATLSSFDYATEEDLSNDNSIYREITTLKNSLYLSAIRSNGTKFEDPTTELINPIILSLGDRKSPNDTISYIDPNFIKIRPNLQIGTSSSVSEVDLKTEVLPYILAKYSIFNTDFVTPLYSSVIIDEVSSAPSVENVSLFIEALANVDYDNMSIIGSQIDFTKDLSIDALENKLIEIPFYFDKAFANDLTYSGFKNASVNAPYLIRSDIKFYNDDSNTYTFLLVDKRKDVNLTLTDSEGLQIDSAIQIPQSKVIDEVTFYNEMEETFANRQVRTAQFPFIDKIMSKGYCNKLFTFSNDTTEIRPLEVDETGRNKQFTSTSVEEDLRVSTSLSGTANGTFCFKKNVAYKENVKINFSENYSMPDSDDYARGGMILQITDILSESDIQDINAVQDSDIRLEKFRTSIINNIDVTIYATPLATDIQTVNPNDIIFIDDLATLIEKK